MLFDRPARRPKRRRASRPRARGSESTLLVDARGAGARGHRRSRAALVLGAAVLLAGALVWLGYRGARALGHAALSRNPHFTVRRYDLQTDGRLTPRLIREYARLPDLEAQPNLLALDLDAIRGELERVPRVREVVVTRRLPGTLAVRIAERTALAQVRIPVPGRPLDMLVDADGHLLGPRLGVSHLPAIGGVQSDGLGAGVLTDPEARAALALLALCDRTPLGQAIRVRRVEIGDADTLLLVLEQGERVRMPRTDLEHKLRELASILVTIDDMRLADDRARVEIDMTTEERFPVRGLRTPPGGGARRGPVGVRRPAAAVPPALAGRSRED